MAPGLSRTIFRATLSPSMAGLAQAAIEDPPGRGEGSFGPLHTYLGEPAGNKLYALYRMTG